MTGSVESTQLELASVVPAEVAVGDEILLKVLVRSASGHDLRAALVHVVPRLGDEALATASMTAHIGPYSETELFAVRVPLTLGRHDWLIRFPEQEIDGRHYGESRCHMTFETRPQRTSLAVWAVPSPVRAGTRFQIKTGAKSAGGWNLGGARVDIRNETGTVVGGGTLSEAAWPGTASLNWTEVELIAPEAEGVVTWSVAVAASEAVPPHEGSPARFSFATVRPPNTRLTVRVVEKGSCATIGDANVRLGVHRGTTDETGLARLEVPDGRYPLTIWKTGYEAASQQLDLAQDLALEVPLTPRPEVSEKWV